VPELPEVHTTATILNKLIKGLVISRVWSGYNSVFHKGKNNIKNTTYFEGFKKNVVGRKILGVSRRGKNVLISLSGDKTILVHMKMTGHLLYGMYRRSSNNQTLPIRLANRGSSILYNKIGTNSKQNPNSKTQTKNKKGWEREMWRPDENEGEALKDPFNRFIRLVFSLSNGKHLALSDVRKFAKVCLLPTKTLAESEDLKALGPEPLDKSFGLETFIERLLLRPKAKIKQALLDQTLIAGIGNIYSDEMLWLSGIHPLSVVSKIPREKFTRLFTAMKTVLRKGIDFRGDSTSDYRNPNGERGGFQHKHSAYQQTGKPCPKRDGGTIKRIIVGARSAHFCTKHQQIF